MTGAFATFANHLQELKTRAFYVLAFVVAGAVVGYAFYGSILGFVLQPLRQQPLYYTSPAGGFELMFNVCIFTGLLVAAPALSYHAFRFVAPALPPRTQSMLMRYVVASCLLFVLGAAFAFFVCVPAALNFLGGFSSPQIHSLLSAPEYLSLLLRYILGFGLLFQLPLVLLLLNAVQPITPGQLRRAGRYVILVSAVVAAVLSPTPDIVNQTILAVPVIVLYYGSAVLIWYLNRKLPQAATA